MFGTAQDVLASIPNVRHFYNLKALLNEKDWKYINSGILDSTHLRLFTKKSMKRMFEEAGYNITMQVGINKITSWKLKLFNILTFGFLNDTKYLQFVCIGSNINK